ncbi:MAG: NAD(P)-dependent oxidoreductase [Bdellovibrionota bacterium]
MQIAQETPSRRRAPSIPRGNDEKSTINEQTLIDDFFGSIIAKKNVRKDDNLKFVIVNHIVPTLPPFLRALEKLGKIAIIIPKHSHADKRIKEKIKTEYSEAFVDVEEYKCNEINRFDDYLSQDSNCIDFLVKKLNLSGEEKFLIIDIGGYFSKPLIKITDHFGKKFIGVVEDTENGHQKYAKSVILKFQEDRNFIFPIVFSVARCELKETEDYNVGKSIVEASGTILRVDAHTMLERMKTIGIIGFGKIGRSIAEHLRQKNITSVVVYDKDEIRHMKASSMGFRVVNKDYILSESDMIFGATGTKSLEGFDFYSLKDNVFIASCTSSNDEFDLSILKRLKERENTEIENSNISKYYLSEKRINFLYQGNAVNFVHGAVNGPYIYSVQASLIVAAISIIENSDSSRKIEVLEEGKRVEIPEITREDMKIIAVSWLECFENFKCQNNLTLNAENLFSRINNSGVHEFYIKPIFYLQFAIHLCVHCKNKSDFDEVKNKCFLLIKLSDLLVCDISEEKLNGLVAKELFNEAYKNNKNDEVAFKGLRSKLIAIFNNFSELATYYDCYDKDDVMTAISFCNLGFIRMFLHISCKISPYIVDNYSKAFLLLAEIKSRLKLKELAPVEKMSELNEMCSNEKRIKELVDAEGDGDFINFKKLFDDFSAHSAQKSVNNPTR